MNKTEFFSWLYELRDEGVIELRALPQRDRAFLSADDHEAIDRWCNGHAKCDLYFGVATRQGGGRKSDIGCIPAVWVDIDKKDVGEAQAQKRIQEFPIKPSAIIASGGGYHVYWKLSRPAQKADIPTIEAINKALATMLGGDPKATDASRILRIPGTHNRKYDPPRECKVIHISPSRVYDLGSLSNEVKGAGEAISKDTGSAPLATGTFRVSLTGGNRDASMFHAALAMAKGGMSRDNIFTCLVPAAAACQPPFEEGELLKCIDSAMSRVTRNTVSMAEEIEAWVKEISGVFSSADIDRELRLETKQDKDNRRQILARLRDTGIIETIGSRAGYYRKVEKRLEKISLHDVPANELKIVWPLQVERFYRCLPKNIIIVAGDQDAGKTAFFFSFCDLNMGRYPINYFSSEMGEVELSDRIQSFGGDIDRWEKGVNFYSRASNFADVIEPDAINIIDYYEISDNFYLVAETLLQIHNTLRDGIAIIGLQKKMGASLGRGAEFSLEKPRLYLAVNKGYPNHECVIVKCKNWVNKKLNPNGLACDFNVRDGCYFDACSEWYRPLPKEGNRGSFF